MPFHWLTALIVTFLVTSPIASGQGNTDEDRRYDSLLFTGSTNSSFHRLGIDYRTGRLYLGATNRLYQLDARLNVEASVSIGPHLDNPSCPPPPTADCSHHIELAAGTPSGGLGTGAAGTGNGRSLTDAVVKALAVDRRSERIIVCTNLFQGHCDRHHLANVTVIDPPVWSMVVPNDVRSPAVVVVAPGPPNPASTDVLYVAATRSTAGLSAYRDIVPSLCVRSRHDLALVSGDDQLNPSRIDVEIQHRDAFRVHYVGGFSSAGFTYFVAVQRPSATADRATLPVTRLARVCQNDRTMASYAELPLECRTAGPASTTFRTARAVQVGHVSPKLARQLGLRPSSSSQSPSDQEHVLFVVFSSTHSSGNSGHASGGADLDGADGGSSVDENDPVAASAASSSALCVYSMREVRRAFTAAIEKCFRGVGSTGPDHLVQPKPCYKTQIDIKEDYCGDYGINHPIKGSDPVSRPALITWQGTSLTSVAIGRTGNYTVAFVGTADGVVKKVVVESDRSAREYDAIVVDRGFPIKQDILLDRAGNYLYAMTERKMIRIKVFTCTEHYSTCSQCLAARDPYCGWCPMLRRCSTMSECSSGGATASTWTSYDDGRCPRIAVVEPRAVPRRRANATIISITAQNLPLPLSPPGASVPLSLPAYQCLFTSSAIAEYGLSETVGTRNGSRISGHVTMKTVDRVERIDSTTSVLVCSAPSLDQLPATSSNSGNSAVKLSVMANGYELISTNVSFYDCNAFNTCIACTHSGFACSWCVERHTCVDSVSAVDECKSDVLVADISLTRNSSTVIDRQFCPLIENVADDNNEIVVPSGKSVSVTVRALHLQSFQTSFKCHFDWNGGVETNAWLSQGQERQMFIECDPFKFERTNNQTHHTEYVSFSVMWGGKPNNHLDNPTGIKVRLYDCSLMAVNCGRCRLTDPIYDCGWCVTSKSCTARGLCETDDIGIGSESSWIGRHDGTCPDPIITKVSPLSGPLQGNTSLTIEGENFGLNANDTVVTVASVDCHITDYQPAAARLVCINGPSASVQQGTIVVTVGNSFVARFEQPFSYVETEVLEVYPTRGPASGGSLLTFVGRHLNSGSQTHVTFSNGSFETACDVTYRNYSTLVCRTAAGRPGETFTADSLTLSIDYSSAAILGNVTFRYLPDPVITSVSHEKGVYSGGSRAVITGERLDSVYAPAMVVYAGNQSFTSPCFTPNSNVMICRTPSLINSTLDDVIDHLDATSGPPSSLPIASLCYGFIMDGVTALLNLSRPATDEHMFHVYIDPHIDEFESGTKTFYFLPNEYLTINGRNLNLALQEPDFLVRIGGSTCRVTSVSSTQLTCLPDLHQNSKIRGKAHVQVLVGDVVYHVGQLDLPSMGSRKGAFWQPFQEYAMSVPFVSGVAIAAGVLLTASVIICVAYHRKSRKSDRLMKRMQCQMDGLEARVAKECKEAFAELQTDMTELVTSIAAGPAGIPFRSYSAFCVRSFFPSVSPNDHAVLGTFQYGATQRNGMERGLVVFNQLINNKIFLLLFVRTLEQRDDFVVREKVNVASLICVVLQNRLEYLTDILKTLLAELIEKTVDSRHHPKLLLRRTESVVEKMLTNWFTILLHGFLKDCVGEPLYMLFRAIRHQVDRGPVDAITGDAKYSLSEDRLIRQQIDHRTVTLEVVDLDAQYNQQTTTVKVLTCDTISQVKDKILDSVYRYVPFSLRPDANELDLEWHTSSKTRIILQDEDSTTKSDGSFRRLNTLSHYKVPDGAAVSLVPRQRSLYSIDSSTSTNKSFTHKYDTLFSSSLPLNRSLSSPNAFNGTVHRDSTRMYHLVKSHDLDYNKKDDRNNKMVSEVYLTRLLATKGTLQQFVDNLFEAIFSTLSRGSVLPVAIKYMMDFLDDQALLHGITDPQVVHTWKSNSLPLRFWVNIIKNPEFILDIQKSSAVDSCLSVIAQTFMDSCSSSELRLGKDSPSSKLLYAKDIPRYKKWVERYYQDIQQMPAISEQDMNAMLCEESTLHQNEFNASAALYELYKYAVKYNEHLMQNLEDDEFARNYRLAFRMSQVHTSMNGTVTIS